MLSVVGFPLLLMAAFLSKADLRRDCVVPPLAGLWWAEDMNSFTGTRDKSRWDWTLMLMVPEWIDQDMVLTGMEQASAKNRPARLDDVRSSLPAQHGGQAPGGLPQ
jgi:hypothetical protein